MSNRNENRGKAYMEKLTFVLPMPMKEEPGGWLIADDPSWKFYLSLARQFEKPALAIPFVADVRDSGPFPQPLTIKIPKSQLEGIKLFSMPYYSSFQDCLRKLPVILAKHLRGFYIMIRSADVVFIRMPHPLGFILFTVAKLQRKSCVLYYAGSIRGVVSSSKGSWNIRQLLRKLGAWIFASFDRMMTRHALTLVTGSELYRLYKTKNNRVEIVKNTPVTQDELSTRSGDPPKEQVTLLYVGRLAQEKGLEYLLRAVAELKAARRERFQLLLVGEGPLKEELETLADKLGVAELVEFLGFKPYKELGELYEKADILVLPSLSEGIPKVLLEAMAKNLPIIATEVGGIPDVVHDEQTGLLVRPRDAKAIERAIARLLDDPNLYARVLEGQRRFIAENTVEKETSRIARIIRDYCDSHARTMH